ncbi:hypothetical protein Q0F99_14045 [Rathayibacter oskolensis]|uniref:hypothetical protein n=1 Tax=Rathayibacter oskolensis TaxID=1891671 RepID=UPI00265FFC63|nr:hypothetical protein [Rathayibacter oskolensis]WKK73422.1 hypothetical protein Q0F99_14045 [Rathayibacter oskolensis]
MRGRAPAAVAVDLLALAVLLGVGVVGFGRVFAGTDHLVAGGLGIAAGLAVGAVAARYGWGLLARPARAPSSTSSSAPRRRSARSDSSE